MKSDFSLHFIQQFEQCSRNCEDIGIENNKIWNKI